MPENWTTTRLMAVSQVALNSEKERQSWDLHEPEANAKHRFELSSPALCHCLLLHRTEEECNDLTFDVGYKYSHSIFFCRRLYPPFAQ